MTETAFDVEWEPELTKMESFGMRHGVKIEWPTMPQLNKLDIGKICKLKTIEFGYTSNLYEIRLGFTGGAKSVGLKTRVAQSQTDTVQSTNLKSYSIDPTKRISDVYICQDAGAGNIYGVRLLDEFGEYLVNANWFESTDAQWKHFKIPAGKEIIGMHGTHDGDYIMSLGLTLWKPNPDAKIMLRESLEQPKFK